MKSNELSGHLDNLLSTTNFRSILIDGHWGCGKTYEIQKYIKNNRKKCIYVSLFGLESIDEINTEIYKQSHKHRIQLAKISTLLSKAFSPVNYVGNIADALAFQLNDINTSKIKKAKIIFLDDLERLSERIEYRDLVGYINNLFMCEVRVVCLVSLEALNNKTRAEDFLEFREKVFDTCLSINGVSLDVFDNLFKDFKIPNCELVYPLFENNIRMAKNVSLFYKDVVKQIKSQIPSKTKLDEYELLKVCTYTVLCVVHYNKNRPSFNEDIYPKLYYNDKCKKYGENIANGLVNFFSPTQEDKNNNYLKIYVEPLIDYFLYREFDDFANLIRINDSEAVDILEQHPFYLSEDNKGKYFEKLKKSILESESWDNKFENCVRYLYSDTDFELSDDEIKKLARLQLRSNQDIFVDETTISLHYFPEGIVNSEKRIHFIDVYQKEYKKASFEDLSENFSKAINDKDYGIAIDLLDKMQFYNNVMTKQLLLDNSFFINDLSGDISESLWTFYHKVAKVAYKLELKDQYKTTIKISFKESTIKNSTLKTRLWALVYYNVDNTFKQSDLD